MSAAPEAPAAVAAALGGWLVERFGGPIDVVGEPTANGAGFDSAIYFVRYGGVHLPDEWRQPLVVRVKPRPDQGDVARHEQAVHDWLASHGYPAPRVLEVFEPGVITPRPTQVIERAPGVMMLDAVKRAPWTAGRNLNTLAALQVQLQRLPVDGFPESVDVVDRRLSLPRAIVSRSDDPALASALEQVDALVPRLRDAPQVVCHGDFHPLNVLVDGSTASVIDWSDGGIGDRHGDVARTLLLLELAAIAAGSRVERVVLGRVGPMLARRYRRAYDRLWPADEQRLALWRPAHLLHGWAQAIGANEGRFDDDGALASRLPPGLIDGLRARFEAAIVAVR